jgi:hypothetical protein
MTASETKLVAVLLADPEKTIAAISGAITDTILHPKGIKKLIPYLIKAVFAGYLLSKFVSPALAERLDLTPKEALAVSFIFGYAGVRILTMTEEITMKELERRFNPSSSTQAQLITTDSSKDSVDAS